MSKLSKTTQSIKPKKPFPVLETILLILGLAIALLVSALDTPAGLTPQEFEKVKMGQVSK